MNEHERDHRFFNWIKSFNRNLVVFLGTFLLNNIIIWIVFAIIRFADIRSTGELASAGVLTFFVPFIGGIFRGLYSTYSTKKFWLITGIWAIILAFGYVPFLSWMCHIGFDYDLNLLVGCTVAGVMLISSLIGFAFRKRREKKRKGKKN